MGTPAYLISAPCVYNTWSSPSDSESELWIGSAPPQVQTMDYSAIVFDTAPTGHTLRLLNFPTILEKGLSKLMGLKDAMGGMMGQVGIQGQHVMFMGNDASCVQMCIATSQVVGIPHGQNKQVSVATCQHPTQWPLP